MGALALVGAYMMSPLPHAAAGALYVAAPPLRPPLIEADLALSRGARERIVRLATTGSLPPGEYDGEFRLAAGDTGLSVRGTVEVIEHDCGDRVFFMTLTGYSPDPYSGFEYVPHGCEPEPDPLGSGHGTARPLGNQWFWIEAS